MIKTAKDIFHNSLTKTVVASLFQMEFWLKHS